MSKGKPLNKTELKIIEKYSEERLLEFARLRKERDIQKAKEDPKYQLALLFANALLARAGYAKISHLEEFQKIKRDDVTKVDRDKLVADLLPGILKIYKKMAIDYSGRANREHYHLTLLKKLSKNLGYKLAGQQISRKKELYYYLIKM